MSVQNYRSLRACNCNNLWVQCPGVVQTFVLCNSWTYNNVPLPEEVIQIYCSLTNQTRKILQISVSKIYKITAHGRARPIILYCLLEKLYIVTCFIVSYLYNFTVITGICNSIQVYGKVVHNYGSWRSCTRKGLRASAVQLYVSSVRGKL